MVFFALATVTIAYSTPSRSLVEVLVAPTDPDWTYELGEPVDFRISVYQNRQLLSGLSVSCRAGPEQMPPETEGDIILDTGTIVVSGGTMNDAGFLRCEATVEVEGQSYSGLGTAGFSPEVIQPTIAEPDDFESYWGHAKEALKKVPMQPRATLVPELCTSEIDVYHVRLNNISDFDVNYERKMVSYFYGMLSVPKKEGKHPAILEVPGAGVRAYGRDDRAANGVIVFKVGIHGIPVNHPDELYYSLRQGALIDYWNYHLSSVDHYYYHRGLFGLCKGG